MNEQVIAQLVDQIANAIERQQTVELFSQRYPDLTLDDAYEIQHRVIQRRLRAGARIAGWKVGYTNRPAQEGARTDRPMYGPIYADTVFRAGTYPAGRFVAPRAEPELCFRLGRELRGDNLTESDVLLATEAVMPAFEMVQRHYHGPASTAVDAVADGGAQAGLVLLEPGGSPAGLDLAAVTMTLAKNGERLVEGRGATVMGHPARPIAWLAAQLEQRGLHLQAGDLISSGSLGGAHDIAVGDRLRLDYPQLGVLEVRITS